MTPDYLKGSKLVTKDRTMPEFKEAFYLKGSLPVTAQEGASRVSDYPDEEGAFASKQRFKPLAEEMGGEFDAYEQMIRDQERGELQAISRVGETIAGLPGDLYQFVKSILPESIAEYFPGKKALDILPTSESLKEGASKLTGGYTDPQSKAEEKFGEVLQDATAFALPSKGKLTFFRNVAIPVVGNLAQEGLKYAGVDEKKAAYAKIGTMIGLDLLSRRTGGIKKYVDNLYSEAEAALPEGTKISTSTLEPKLLKLKESLEMGGKRPTSVKALEKVNELLGEIEGGQIDARRLQAFRPSINEAIQEVGGFSLEVPKGLKPKAIRNLRSVNSEVIGALEDYGRKSNPEYLKLSQSANEAYAANAKSRQISEFISKKFKGLKRSPSAHILFSAVAVPAAKAVGMQGAAAGAAGYTALKGGEMLYRVMKSPTLRKYYLGTLKAAAARNGPAVIKNIRKLDEELEED